MRQKSVAVITPAFGAHKWIGAAVASVLAQNHSEWEHWIIADDGTDYAALLAEQGLSDPRQRFVSSGGVGFGASVARNVALAAVETRHAAILDADDRMKPDKLDRALDALETHAIVSSALDVCSGDGRLLRQVGTGPDRLLRPGAYKFTNLSMDSMIVWDRMRCDARYDTTLSNMTDLELLMQLWQQAPATWHLGRPAHDYFKISSSMSNGAGFTEGMIRSKQTLLARLKSGHYAFIDPQATAGLTRFLEISLAAEARYPAALAARPELLFEDHLEPLLAKARREAR
ncbi:glycosyltransferase family 2 protein [Devosia sp.]|uniref:glycosyltransferase family 2 protein n=1 Tax=Devosia sp. TaxID=1871048 RepID=UPI003A92881F